MDLSKYAKQKIEEWRNGLNLTEEEEQIFLLLTKGKSRQIIAGRMKLSMRTIDRRIAAIRKKMEQMKEGTVRNRSDKEK